MSTGFVNTCRLLALLLRITRMRLFKISCYIFFNFVIQFCLILSNKVEPHEWSTFDIVCVLMDNVNRLYFLGGRGRCSCFPDSINPTRWHGATSYTVMPWVYWWQNLQGNVSGIYQTHRYLLRPFHILMWSLKNRGRGKRGGGYH